MVFKDRFNSYEMFYDRTRKGRPFNACDFLIEVNNPSQHHTLRLAGEYEKLTRYSFINREVY
jgi:hypothetical protein